jgi:hypothetical protein
MIPNISSPVGGNIGPQFDPIQDFIKQSVNLEFNPGPAVYRVGHPEPLSIPGFEGITGVQRHYIYGDGSCWSRALWQDILNQILHDPHEFNAFIQKVAQSTTDLNIDAPLAQATINMLYKIRSLSPENRIEYLNHDNVDRTLIFFMRHVAGEFMSRNFSIYDPETIDDIKTNINRYGGPEINAFARYFNLATHLIHQQKLLNQHNMEWFYREKPKNTTQSTLIPVSQLNMNINHQMVMFAANDFHFEVINFTNAVRIKQFQLDEAMAKQVEEEWNKKTPEELEAEKQKQEQIEKDKELAKQIEGEWDTETHQEIESEMRKQKQIAGDEELAKQIEQPNEQPAQPISHPENALQDYLNELSSSVIERQEHLLDEERQEKESTLSLQQQSFNHQMQIKESLMKAQIQSSDNTPKEPSSLLNAELPSAKTVSEIRQINQEPIKEEQQPPPQTKTRSSKAPIASKPWYKSLFSTIWNFFTSLFNLFKR